MRHIVVIISFVIGFSLLATSCSKSKKSSGSQTHVVYMGDVMNLLKDTKNNPQPDVEFFKKLDGKEVFFYAVNTFSSVGEYSTIPQSEEEAKSNLEKEEAPDTEDAFVLHPFQVRVKTGQAIELTSNIDNDQIAIILPMNEKEVYVSQKYSNKGIRTKFKSPDGNEEPFLVHFSESPDKELFSLMLYNPRGDRNSPEIVIMYFSLSSHKGYKKTDKPYSYIAGQGIKVKKDLTKPIRVDVCGEDADAAVRDVQTAMSKWTSIFKSEKIKHDISLGKKHAGFYPVSDLSQNCIQIINDFMVAPEPFYAFYGATIGAINFSRATIVNSNMLIFSREFRKQGYSIWSKELTREREFTFVHELGHFFGLDHQFDKSIDSVMSYSYNVMYPTKYDRDALIELYK